jgi:DNA polymerase-3 subunit beta
VLTLQTKPFREAVAKAASAAKPKSPKPVLSCLRLSAMGGRMAIEGTDCETWIFAECECQGDDVTLLLNATLLSQWLQMSKAETLTITMAKAEASLNDGRKFKMPTVADGEFPTLPPVTGNGWEVPAGLLRAALRTNHATCGDSAKYAMGGICFDVSEGERTVIGCNGRTMAVQPIGPSKDAEGRIIFPAGAARRLAAMLPTSGTVRVVDDSRRVSFAWDGCRYESSLLEGRFPQWRKALPSGDALAECSVPVEQFATILKSAKLATDELNLGATIAIKDGELSVSAKAGTLGESTASVPVASLGEASAEYDPQYILDHLAECDRSSSVRLVMHPPGAGEGPLTMASEADGFLFMAAALGKKRG